ncbi:MAG: methionine synthase [Candidatus Zixiibacteriota bacterium]|jgi:5-methyltetrahydropteroyltriglutamate--homocysteine methyltransferase
MLLTTTVGSFPKPDYLVKARNEFASGKLSQGELTHLEKKATEECIRLQEGIGLDILVHGEMERGDMVTFFAEKMKGFGISGLVRSYGNRYYPKPVVKGSLKRERPITVDMFKYAQSLTEKPVKGIVTGPYTMCDWSFNEYYPDRGELVMALAKEIHQEVVDLERAGAKYIQIDEPAISTRPDEVELAVEAMKLVTEGIEAKTISHICYGDFAVMYPRILDLAVDQLDLEFANSDFANLEIFRHPEFTKEIAVGVLDVHSHIVEKKDEVKANIRKALGVFPVENVYIDPDCGLKTRTPDEAEAKLRVMVETVKEVRQELGVE